eukprot:jgi/Ulvmu1/10044/UM059_0094.1
MLAQKCRQSRGWQPCFDHPQLPSSLRGRCGAVQFPRQATRRALLPYVMAAAASDCSVYPGHIMEAASLSGPMDVESVVFYTHVLCPYAERVWLALLEKNIAHTLVQVDLSGKPSWYRRLNPRGLVPCLTCNSDTIIESEDICRWIDAEFDGPALMPPAGSSSRQTAEQAISLSSNVASVCLNAISANNRASWSVGANASDQQLNSFASACNKLGDIAEQSSGPFLVGESPGIADFMSWPFVNRALFCAKQFSGFDVGASDSRLGVPTKAWIVAMQSREQTQLTRPDETLLRQVLESTRRLDWFDYQTAAVDRLHPHLNPSKSC